MTASKGWRKLREGVYVKHPGGTWVLAVELIPRSEDRWHWRATGEVAGELLEINCKLDPGVHGQERAQQVAEEAYAVLKEIGQMYGKLRKIEVRS